MNQRVPSLHSVAEARRKAEQEQAAQLRARTQAALTADKAAKAYWRAQAQAAQAASWEHLAYANEEEKRYYESRIAQVDLQNEQTRDFVNQLNSLLSATLSVDDFFDLETLKVESKIPPRVIPSPPDPPPALDTYLPAPLRGLDSLLPWVKEKHNRQVEDAHARYNVDQQEYQRRQTLYQEELAQARDLYDQHVAEIKRQTDQQHSEVDQLRKDFEEGKPDAIAAYFMLVLEASVYPTGFPQRAKLAYVPESKQLVVEYDLPAFEIVPEATSYKYVKSKDEIASTPRPATQRKALYSSVIAQVALRTIHELFEADRGGYLQTIVFNGYVDTIDRATGRPARPCLVTVRTTREAFLQLDLSRVDPTACLKALNASVSKNPAELAPVRPVLEFNMVDPRFIQETDVLSALDQRPNLMELKPPEFEALISNLFEKMGLETRLTQASRDGGVDCVAYDPRPIFGGKVVIQAKRYKNTVGVSAVRDLFGTVQNEGASKGILVTTSGYGKAAYEFANGKPLELLSGSNLLYLLSEHAGLEARIEVPADWKDPQADIAED
jgi:restriction system protein